MEIVPIFPKLAIIFLFAACLSVHSIQATDIKYCNKKTNYVVKVDDVEISPYPVSTGEPTTFTIKASTGQALTGGKMALDVSYFGVKVHSESHSICEKTSCPISVGKFVLSHTQTLPGITPPVSKNYNCISFIDELLECPPWKQ
ncbi:MD-2-related lipid-recognition protein ROSY1-like isoform X3 [Camellia sinensis]|uniref:MD-2-related lipid-recognition protein ROSY1-like isoform X3 n=1 Tax=Camellia sinensis TaxID=4442 RepID=UPI001035DE3C|nr:MD-2-related lipid-recognition protein ROSY1-like isoform X3 [Camellia sinensis]